jgi:hypothetical protein
VTDRRIFNLDDVIRSVVDISLMPKSTTAFGFLSLQAFILVHRESCSALYFSGSTAWRVYDAFGPGQIDNSTT